MEVPDCPPTPPLLTEGLSSPKHDAEPQTTLPKEGPSSPRSGSPEPNCPICLGPLDNKSYSDSCFHKFCFKCLLEWSKVKAECPLCKQKFKSIIHNVKSMDEYDQYTVQPAVDERERLFMVMDPWSMPPWFMRRHHQATVRRHAHLPPTVGQAGVRPFFQFLDMLPSGPGPSSFLQHRERRAAPLRSNQHSGLDQRRNIYRSNLWAQPLADVTGRTREFSLAFYKRNVATTHRLLPWISRDLSALCERAHIAVALERINGLLTRHDMRSSEFANEIREFLGEHTRHFMHELISYARSPYDMMGYDREVRHSAWYPGLDSYGSLYGVDNSSSEDDIMEVPLSPSTSVRPRLSGISCPLQAEDLRISSPEPGPSGIAFNVNATINLNSPLLIESSDEDTIQPTDNTFEASLSDVEVVAVLKPKHERTPEIVDLLSDSDNELEAPPLPDLRDIPSTSWQGLENVTADPNPVACDTNTSAAQENIDTSSDLNVERGPLSDISVSAEVSVPMRHKHKKSHKKCKRRMLSSSDDDSKPDSRQKKRKNCCCQSGVHSDDDKKSKKRKIYDTSSSCDEPVHKCKNTWSTSSEDSDCSIPIAKPVLKSKIVWKIHEALFSTSSDEDSPPVRPKIRSIVVKRQQQAQESGSSTSSYTYSQQYKSDSESSWEPDKRYRKNYSKIKDKGKGKGKGKKRSH